MFYDGSTLYKSNKEPLAKARMSELTAWVPHYGTAECTFKPVNFAEEVFNDGANRVYSDLVKNHYGSLRNINSFSRHHPNKK
jgi:hypothetical protein